MRPCLGAPALPLSPGNLQLADQLHLVLTLAPRELEQEHQPHAGQHDGNDLQELQDKVQPRWRPGRRSARGRERARCLRSAPPPPKPGCAGRSIRSSSTLTTERTRVEPARRTGEPPRGAGSESISAWPSAWLLRSRGPAPAPTTSTVASSAVVSHDADPVTDRSESCRCDPLWSCIVLKHRVFHRSSPDLAPQVLPNVVDAVGRVMPPASVSVPARHAHVYWRYDVGAWSRRQSPRGQGPMSRKQRQIRSEGADCWLGTGSCRSQRVRTRPPQPDGAARPAAG